MSEHFLLCLRLLRRCEQPYDDRDPAPQYQSLIWFGFSIGELQTSIYVFQKKETKNAEIYQNKMEKICKINQSRNIAKWMLPTSLTTRMPFRVYRIRKRTGNVNNYQWDKQLMSGQLKNINKDYYGIGILHQKITKLIQPMSKDPNFKQFAKGCKRTSREMMYYLKRLPINGEYQKDLIDQLEKYFTLLLTFVNSTEFLKCGHRLPLLLSPIKVFEQMFSKKIQPIESLLLQKIQQHEKQQYYRRLELKAIEQREQKSLKNGSVNEVLSEIANNQIFRHHACVCCSQAYIKNCEITNSNIFYPTVVGLSEKEYSEVNLERYVCSLCNTGGGVILVGVEKKRGLLYASGIKFKDMNHAIKKQAQICNLLLFIQPKFYGEVQKLIVHTNVLQKTDVAQEFYRLCFRILIFPFQQYRKYYLQIANKGYHRLYQYYQFDKNMQPEKITSYPIENMQIYSFYKLIVQKFRKKKNSNGPLLKKTNSHKGILCYKPTNQYSKIFGAYYMNYEAEQIANKQQFPQNEQNEYQIDFGDTPNFKYSNNSLLAVGSKKKDRYITELRQLMISKKMQFQAEKPYWKSFKDGSRSIWLFSHSDRHQVIKQLIKQFDVTGSITLIPVYKTLQIDRARLTPQKEALIQQRFKQRFPEGYEMVELEKQEQEGMTKYPVMFTFDSYPSAIYGYMIFESIQLRPYFVKENTTYKKKQKNKSE